MRKQSYIILSLLMISILACVAEVRTQGKVGMADGFNKMSLDLKLNKTEFFVLEPVSLQFRFYNNTKESLRSVRPNYANDLRMRIHFKDKIKEHANLFGYSVYQLRTQSIFVPDQGIDDGAILQRTFKESFQEIGNYRIDFILAGDGDSKILTKEVKISYPTGISKEALGFIKRYMVTDTLFGNEWNERVAGGSHTLLEEFVDKYASSVYGEYAILKLGYFYANQNELSRAKAEFDKIISSENEVIGKAARQSLSEIDLKLLQKAS